MRSLILLGLVASVAAGPLAQQQPGFQPGFPGNNGGFPGWPQQSGNRANIYENNAAALAIGSHILGKIPLFKTVSSEGKTEFLQIIGDQTAKKKDIETKLDVWANKYQIAPQWQAFKTEYDAKRTELISALRNFVNRLPSAFDSIVQIDNNKEITGQETMQQIGTVISNVGQGVGAAFQNFFEFIFGNSTDPESNNNNGGFPGNNNGGFPGNNNGGFPGNNGGFPSGNNNNNGGFPGNNGQFPGNNNNNNGGFPGNNNQFPGNNGGFPGNNNAGFPGNNGGFPSGNNNGGQFPGQGSNGGFPGSPFQIGGNGQGNFISPQVAGQFPFAQNGFSRL